MPRASGRQCGAYNPLKAGTKINEPESLTLAASISTSLNSFMIPEIECELRKYTQDLNKPKLSRSHLSSEPATAIDPSSAKCVGALGPSLYATVVSRPYLD